jgi:hypothetical protein
VITAEDTLLHDDEGEKTSPWPAIGLAAFAILVGIFVVKYGLGTLAWLEAKSLADSNAWVADVPQPIAQTPAPDGKIDQIKLYNFQFNAPWPGKFKTEEHLTHTILRFDSGQVLVFYDPDTQKDTIGTLKSSDPANYQKFAAVFSGAPIESNYALYQQVYGAAPSSLSPFMNGADAQREHTLLIWKLAFGADLIPDGAFHSFDWGTVKGFQFGDPTNARPVAVRAFDERNRQFRYLFIVSGGSNALITQGQMDSAVRSLKPVPFLDR